MDKVLAALNRIKDVDPTALDAAEKHPLVLKGIIISATRS